MSSSTTNTPSPQQQHKSKRHQKFRKSSKMDNYYYDYGEDKEPNLDDKARARPERMSVSRSGRYKEKILRRVSLFDIPNLTDTENQNRSSQINNEMSSKSINGSKSQQYQKSQKSTDQSNNYIRDTRLEHYTKRRSHSIHEFALDKTNSESVTSKPTFHATLQSAYI